MSEGRKAMNRKMGQGGSEGEGGGEPGGVSASGL